jgi:hypothetical protein
MKSPVSSDTRTQSLRMMGGLAGLGLLSFLAAVAAVAGSPQASSSTTRKTLPSHSRSFSSDPKGYLARLTDARRFAVGDRIFICCGEKNAWVPGTLREIRDDAPPYRVEWDEHYKDSKLWASGIAAVGIDLATPSTSVPADTFGTWKLDPAWEPRLWPPKPGTDTKARPPVGPRESAEEHAKRAAVEFEYGSQGGPRVTIKPDGAYEWYIPGSPLIQGRWEKEPKPSGRKGVVVLPRGEGGRRWWVGFTGRDPTGSPHLHLLGQYENYVTEYTASLLP